MSERLIPKLDRLGAEAGIKQMTPEIYKFAMLVRADVVAQWPEREWVGLTDDAEIFALSNTMPYADRFEFARAVEDKLKEKNT